jgi:hypothetical protein
MTSFRIGFVPSTFRYPTSIGVPLRRFPMTESQDTEDNKLVTHVVIVLDRS